MTVLLSAVVEASDRVAEASGRLDKRRVIAELLAGTDPDLLPTVVGLISGSPRQGRVGIGWASVADVDVPPADRRTLSVREVDDFLDAFPGISGETSQSRRQEALASLLTAATEQEQRFLRRVLTGELRQGALEGMVADAVAEAFDVPAASVRRAAMLSGDLGRAAVVAALEGEEGLGRVGLEVLTGVQPMLAKTAQSVADALDSIGTAAVEWKLDGTRIQAHRRGSEVRIFTRNLNDVTDRLPDVVDRVLEVDAASLVLDGESMGLDEEGGPRPFEETMSRFGSEGGGGMVLRPFWFDILHLDGTDLIDLPLGERRRMLEGLMPTDLVPQIVTDDVAEAEQFLAEARALRHEGVMVKDPDGAYLAGRRGSGWLKVKPVYTLDLVIIAAEWGSGRRTGWLSNLHLAARDPATGGFVMLGKTFKGLTDAMLEWQTKALLDLEVRRTKGTVHVRPELVVEIAFDGLLPSTRYPGGMVLRFARVRAHRPDKGPSDADTIGTVREIFESRR